MVSKMQSLLLCVAACLASAHGFSLDCMSLYQMDFGTPIGDRFGGYCSINFADNDYVNLVGITGDTGSKTIADIEYLYVYGFGPTGAEGVDRLPSNLKALVPNLVSLTWSSRLKYVSASDFSSWPNLVQLNLYNNLIRQLPGNLLANNQKLQWIDFSMNSISVIGSGFFNGLNALTQLSFYSNPCISQYSQSMDIAQAKADLLYFCEAIPAPVSNVCPAACSARISAVETKVNTAAAQVDTINKFVALL